MPRRSRAMPHPVVAPDPVVVRIEYVEAAFTCGFKCIPDEDLATSLFPAALFGQKQAKEKLGVDTEPFLCGPLVKENGEPYTLSEWAQQFFLGLRVKDSDKDEGLLGQLNRERKFKEELMNEGIAKLALDKPQEKGGARLMELEKEQDAKKEKPDCMQELLAKIETVEADLKARIVTMESELKAQEVEFKAQEVELKSQKVELKAQKVKLEAQEQELKVLRTVVTPIEDILLRKLLEQFRKKAAGLISSEVSVSFQSGKYSDIPEPAWWSNFILDESAIATLSRKSGIDFDQPTLKRTAYGFKTMQFDSVAAYYPNSSMTGGKAAHEIFESKELYASIVCAFSKGAREQLKKIYKFVFGSDAESDAFDLLPDDVCCRCKVHCPVSICS